MVVILTIQGNVLNINNMNNFPLKLFGYKNHNIRTCTTSTKYNYIHKIKKKFKITTHFAVLTCSLD